MYEYFNIEITQMKSVMKVTNEMKLVIEIGNEIKSSIDLCEGSRE